MADALTAASIPALAPTFRFQWEEAQDCYVILYPEGMVKLSGTAGEIMKRCDGAANVAEIIASLKQAFGDVPLDDDVNKFLEVARDNGWIRIR